LDLVDSHFWYQPVKLILKNLSTTQDGLSQREAITRLKSYGRNELSATQESHVILQLLRRFKSPLVILLLITSVISLLLKQTSDSIIIIVMVFFSVGLDFIQEYSANQAAKKLKESISLKAKVLRNGKLENVAVQTLVPGDIVYLTAGDMIPADGRILWENHLFVNQAILTGESFPVEKQADDLPTMSQQAVGLDDAKNALFMGTSVVSGECHMVVCVTGDKAYLGTIAESLRQEPPPSQFELETKKFGYFLMRVTIFLVLFVLLVNIFFHRPWLETFLFALALAVGMTPEFLPMVMSVTLARGAKKMAKKSVIVKRLSAIHDIGGMNILCTDKTGTLTEAKIELARHVDCEGNESEHVLFLAYLNSYFETGLKNPMDEAILSHEDIDVKDWKKIDEIPFDFERRRVSVLLEHKQERLLIAKGAPEDILSICTHFEHQNKSVKITPKVRTDLQNLFHQESKKGFRVLGIAWQSLPKTHETATHARESDLIFAGFALFYDPPKLEASQTLEKLKALKIDVYILTGDSEDVTTHLCNELSIPIRGLLTGKDMDKLDENALASRVRTTNLYCRITPAQKRRIILELKNQGYVVGFLGDGINDAPSLYAAHAGISVDTGADVAKEAADLILLKHNLNVIYDAVIEGRKIYSNIIKYLMMMTSSNFGNMFSMAGASVLIPFLPMLPTQILLNNLLYDISQTSIPFDKVDPESIVKPQQWNLRLIFRFMLVMGPLSSLFDFLIFFIMFKVLQTPASLFQTGWFMESLATQILIIFVIRTRKSIFQSRPHPFLAVMAIALVSIGIYLPYSPLSSYFNFVHPPFYFLLIIFAIVVIYLSTAEKIKFWFYKKFA
jgi:Mg2+-importing ATPase